MKLLTDKINYGNLRYTNTVYGGIKMSIISIESDILSVKIDTKGAELQSIYHKQRENEYLWNGDPAHWGRRSPLLFPFVGRLKDDEAMVEDMMMKCSQHGFVRDMEFEVVTKADATAQFCLKSNDETRAIYPYLFNLYVTYEVEGAKLNIKWKVENKDGRVMYFSIGGHPAFNVPFVEGTKSDDYYLEYEKTDNMMEFHLDPPYVKDFTVIKDIPRTYIVPRLFSNDALIYSGVKSIILGYSKMYHGIKVTIDKFPFVGIWSKYHENGTIAPFVCIEPWFGIADSHQSTKIFKEKLGINELNAGGVFDAGYTIEIL